MRKGAREVEGMVELLLISTLPPPLVIPVLATPGGVGSDGLQVAVLVGADPDVCPRWRDRERLDAPAHRGGHTDTVGADVGEALAAPAPDDPGRGAIGASEAGHGSLRHLSTGPQAAAFRDLRGARSTNVRFGSCCQQNSRGL